MAKSEDSKPCPFSLPNCVPECPIWMQGDCAVTVIAATLNIGLKALVAATQEGTKPDVISRIQPIQ